ncbi:tetratricopeptide repeat protein [Sulfurimonas sp.]|uniref:tetratricopeptide repeat protein n=1 Tax=Sulfurimonas sp. TaxID=2022749 RepID=UPI003D14E819
MIKNDLQNFLKKKRMMKKEVSSIAISTAVSIGVACVSGAFVLGKFIAQYEYMEQQQEKQKKSLISKIVETEILSEEFSIPEYNKKDKEINKTIQKYIRDNRTESENKLEDTNQKCYEGIDYKEPYIFEEKQVRAKNSEKMVNLCQKAVLLDPSNSKTLFYLAVAYNKNRDYTRAIESLEESANLENRIAQRKLGIMYRTGSLVEKNTEKYSHYFSLASANGDKASKIIQYHNYY